MSRIAGFGIAFLLASVALLAACQSTPEPPPETVRVVVLAGQSNMVGSGRVDDLPQDLSQPFPDVPIWDPKTQSWAPVRGGSYAERKSFGPEVGFAHAVAEAGHDVRLVKLAQGGTGLVHDWNPAREGSLHHQLIAQCEAAAASVAPARIEWVGLLWMQGEEDSKDSQDPSAARAYEDNLRDLVGRIREELGAPALPVVIGRLHDELGQTKPHVGLDFGQFEVVRAAQARLAESDPLIEWIDTDGLALKDDRIHFDSDGCLRLGRAFADAWLRLTADA